MSGTAYEPLAIVGMACRLPGANNLAEYWRMLIEGRSAIREIPADRFNQELYYDPIVGTPGKSYSKLAAVLADRDFHRGACPIDQQLEESADITHLMMCETAATALRHAEMDPFGLAGKNVGVYIGHVHGSSLIGDYTYATFIEEAADFLNDVDDFRRLPPDDRQAVMEGLIERVQKSRSLPSAKSIDVGSCMAAGVVSKAFDLSGPFLSLDSACASSLQALLFAARALQTGQIEMAIVGGASDCKPNTLVLFSYARALSATGSRPFDADADGMICAEGCVSIVLKTLERAIADGDPIQTVIRGLGVSSDGRGKSLWAPRKEGQIKAMQRAYGPDVDMSSLQYVEAHATATQVGDATELQTLADILTPHLPPGEKIPIGSAKANVGHTLESAGIASLIKTVLSMQHGQVPPIVNLRNLNPKVDWDSAPFYVPTTAVPWPAARSGQPRRAGVNAFGIGGLNMHVILEEFAESRRGQARSQTDSLNFAATPSINKEDVDAVAVVGMGCLFPGALDIERFWDLLRSGRDPKQAVPADRWRLDVVHSLSSDQAYHRDAMVGGFMTDFQYDWRRHKVPPKQIANADPLQFMLLEATDQAMRDAGYDKREFDRTRTGVVVGTEFGGDFACQLHMGLRLPETEELLFEILAARGVTGKLAENIVRGYASSLLSQWTAMNDETGSFTASTLASRLAKTWNLMGGAAAIDSGSTSALAALAVSFNALLVGDCDTMICAAGQRRMAWPEFEMLDQHGMLAAERPVRSPLDSQATGVVPGEGVGAVVLKRLSQARQDGDRIRAVIRGVRAAHAESWGDALELAMERAFQTANVTPAEASCMEFDGAGPTQQTHEQLHAVASYFGQDARRQPLLISSVTSQIGHTHGASGMASLIKASMELESGEMPAAVGFDQPTSVIAKKPSKITSVADRTPIHHTTSAGTRIAAVSSTSRGMAYCAVVEGGQPKAIDDQQITPAASSAETSTAAAAPPSPAVPAASADLRICRIGASNRAELLSTLQAASSNGSIYAQAATRRFRAADRARLAIVADDPESCQKKLQLARQHLDNPAATTVLEQQGIFCREPAEKRPRIAFVFPGQGSQYVGMLRELVREVPVAAKAMSDADQTMRRNGFPTFAQLAWTDDSTMGSEVWPTQVAVLLADHIVHAAITDLGIQAEVVLGHSYGELPALLAGGAWDFETAVRVTRARCDGIADGQKSHGAMMATTATPDVIDKLIGRVEGPVYVATHNAPDQTVIGGTDEALTQIGELLRAENYQTRSIPVPCAFHTPLMHDANGPLEEAVRTANIQRPRITTFSWVTNRPVKASYEIRTRLLAHYTSPVWYVDLIRSIAEQDETIFVEVGPNQICTRMHQRILDGDGTTIIACDNPKRPGVQQLWQVRALLECTGALDDGGNGSAQPAVSTTKDIPIPQVQRTATYFDATAQRRNKMRRAAMSSTASKYSTSEEIESPFAPSSSQTASAAPHSHAKTRFQEPSEPDATRETSDSEPALTTVSTSQLEQFLIAFVVEQTGYPPDVVELDADLEADLGIDSIKKVQLFAELQPYFEVQAAEDLTLDDFPTLRHVVDFLKDVPIKQRLTTDSTSSDDASAATLAPEPSAATAVPEAPAAPAADAATSTSAADILQLESFLINFVVEQTGYPPDVVELDADLEADLGIDSIKKVQLFAELQPYFEVQAAEDLTLDDFPTLRHVVDFLKDVPIKQPLTTDSTSSDDAFAATLAPEPSAATAAPEASAAPAAASSTSTSAAEISQLESFLINFVVEQTGYPPDVVELDADLEADLGIDSIKKVQLFAELQPYFEVEAAEDLTLDDFPTLRHVVDFLKDVPIRQPLTTDSTSSDDASAATLAPEPSAATAAPEAPAAPAAGAATSTSAADILQLESFLINFVVEQTGYPPDVVELDADLEADLGIDSIKKVQLFAELQPYFDVQAAEDLTLDDFPTLRHVVDFLKDVPIRQPLSSDQNGSADIGPVPSSSMPSSLPSGTTEPTTTPPQSSVSADQPATVDRANNATEGPSPSAAETTANRAASISYQAGCQRGDQLKGQILDRLRQIADFAGSRRETLVIPNGAIKNPAGYFSLDELDELRGMADAVQVPLGNIVAYHFADASPSAPDADVATSQLETAKWDLDDDDPTASITERFQLRMLPVPWPAETPKQSPWQGPALVIGRNATADALRERLALDGISVLQLSTSLEMNIDQTLDEFDRLWQQQPIPHLFLLSGRDAEAENINEETAWDDRYRRGVLMPMLICQRWMLRAGEANLLDRCTLVSAVQLGGDFGFSSYVTAPEGGALTGLTKAIYIETVALAGHKGLRLKAIDAPANESPEELAKNIIRELAAGTVDYEVAFVNGERYLQNAYPCDADVKDYADIRRGETWVVTGGARGITAECALALGRRFGLKLHLIGTSPLPQIDPAWRELSEAELNDLRSTTMREARRAGQLPNVAWQRVEKAIEIDQTLQRFASAGIHTTYHACDVSDRGHLANVLDKIRQTDGPIEGILHGAGVDRSCRFEKKTREGIQATIGSKALGAYNLMTLTGRDPIRHFIAFGSISGRLGSNGQVDYCAASDMLCKLVSWQRTNRPACHSVAFHFHPWDDVGMASKPEVKSMMRAADGPVPMPKREGVRQFLRELYAGTPCSEVLVTSREYYTRFYGDPEESLRQRQQAREAPTSPARQVEMSAESTGDRLTRRLVLRMSDAPLNRAAGVEPKLDGAAVIVGHNPAALALRDRLQAFGASVFILDSSDDPDDAVNELNRLWEQHPISHLFLMTPHDGDVAVGTDEALFARRCQCGVLVPFMLCQQWIRLLKNASLLDKATLYACTALGGDFGISGNITAVESGGLTGLIKSLHVEIAKNLQKGIKLKAIDFAPQETPAAMANAICRELASDTPDLEVGYAGGDRRALQMIAQPVERTAQRRINKGGTWVVTGGARGITAVAALALGKRFGLRLHLLGTSPPPQIDDSWRDLSEEDLQQLKTTVSRLAHEKGQSPRQAWKQVEKAMEIDRSLGAFRKAGVRATYHCCDVTDLGQLAEVLDRIRESDGSIEGVIHGAGIAIDARFENKKRENILNTLTTKVGGTANLIALTAEDPLRFFVGFGSVAGRFGAKGQSDYAAANDMLCKQIDWLRSQCPDCVAIGIHWHGWDEVGMAVQPDVKANFEKTDYRLMPTREGVAHLIDELTMGGTAAEVVFTDAPQLGRRRRPSNEGARDGVTGSDSPAAERPGVERAKGLPMIGQVTDSHPGRQLTIETRLDPRTDPFLIDHKMGGRPLLPAVIEMELCAEAASLIDDRQFVGFRDVRIHAPLPFPNDDCRTVRVTVTANETCASCELTSDHFDRKGRMVEADRLIMSANAELADAATDLSIPYCGLPWIKTFYPFEYDDRRAVVHGPRFQSLKGLYYQYDGGFAQIIAPPLSEIAGARGDRGWHLPPSVLDACLFACSTYGLIMFEGRVGLPLAFDRIRFASLPSAGEICIVRIHYRGQEDKETFYDFDMFGEDQRVLLAVEGFHTTVIPTWTHTFDASRIHMPVQ